MPAPGCVTLVAPAPWPLGERVSHGAWCAIPLPDPENPNRHIVDVPADLVRWFVGTPAGFALPEEQ